MKLVLALILGALFGIVLYTSQASAPKKLIAMLRLQDLSLMKIILFAIGFSSTLLALANLLGQFQIDHFSIKTTNLGVIIGGLLFGIGFGTVGTCPGTCVAASGSGGYKKAIAAVLGGLAGALVFSLTYAFWKDLGIFSSMDMGKLTIFRLTDSIPSILPIGFGGLMAVGILFMIAAYFIPEKFK